MRRYFLIITHAGPERCRCSERTRSAAGSADLQPTDTHDFIGALARDRYVVNHVDPRCQVEKRNEQIGPRALAGMALS
jgi:hypothetical protein